MWWPRRPGRAASLSGGMRPPNKWQKAEGRREHAAIVWRMRMMVMVVVNNRSEMVGVMIRHCYVHSLALICIHNNMKNCTALLRGLV